MVAPPALPKLAADPDGVSMAEFGKYANDLRKVCVATATQTRQLQAFIRKLERQTGK
jgi:hypothetical protein